jgi:hypothetical protein
MNGVAATKAGLVAVGWTAARDQPATASARKPAVWTSPDGGTWTLQPAPSGGSTRLGELTDVTALPDGTLVTAGTDWAADAADGDGALLTSVDGRGWDRAPARGLDGPGPSTLRRLLAGPGGDLVAVGTRLDGSASRSVLWSAPDRLTWSASPLPATGSALGSAWGLARLGDGTLVVTGFRAAADGTRMPLLWSGAGDLRAVPTTGATGSVYATIMVDGVLTALGGTDTGAAAWTVALPT